MEKKNRYRNRVGAMALCRLILGCVLLLAAGVSFVLVRNQHVITGNEIRAIEDRVVGLDREIEMWELRIAGVRDRQELSRRLRWVQSDLKEIEGNRLIEVGLNSVPLLDIGQDVKVASSTDVAAKSDNVSGIH